MLLTYAAREKQPEQASPRSFQEVQELRASLGRRWDEMERWTGRKSVRTFYAPAGEGPSLLLRLVVDHHDYVPDPISSERFPLLAFLQQRMQQTHLTATAILDELWLLYSLLREWYEQKEMHNCLGTLFFSKEYKLDRQGLLSKLTSPTVLRSGPLQFLYAEISKLPCLNADVSTLTYEDHGETIQGLLLLVNAFPAVPHRFDFASFAEGKWSLEHIFPQNPRQYGAALHQDDQALLNDLIPEAQRDEELSTLLEQPELNKDEQKQLKTKLKVAAPLLHGVGNMALLQRGDNSAMSNGFFDEKRQRIIRRISAGSFVPTHTFNVFSKLILPDSQSLRLWSKPDMEGHTTYLENERLRIHKHFTSATPLSTI